MPPRRFIPGFPLAVTLEQLLTHSAGFKPWYPFYLYRPQDDLEQMVMAVDSLPGSRVEYSDVGYILLRHLLERVSGAAFQELAAQRDLHARSGLRDTFIGVPPALKRALRAHRDRQPLRARPWPAPSMSRRRRAFPGAAS